MIYPEEAGGFDKVFARIHITNVYSEGGGGFFQSYTVKSLKKKSAVLLTPKKLSSFIEDLKVLIDLNADATFILRPILEFIFIFLMRLRTITLYRINYQFAESLKLNFMKFMIF